MRRQQLWRAGIDLTTCLADLYHQSDMDPTLLGAYIGALSALAGAIVGGAVPALTQYLMTRRVERRERKRLARVIQYELMELLAFTTQAVTKGRWWPSDTEVSTKVWDEHRSAFAPELPPLEWKILTRAYMHAGLALYFRKQCDPDDPHPLIDDRDRAMLEKAAERLQAGLDAITPMADVRFLAPKKKALTNTDQ